MRSDILVTVLMPCYNAAKYLNLAVDSILSQTYANIELLLIDDGSIDDTKSIIDDYARADERVKVYCNEYNLGLIKTLNKGISLARGSYIARMDADDISAKNRIEVLLYKFLELPELDVISAGYYYISESGNLLRRVYPKALVSDALKFVSFFCTPVNHPCVMAKASVFKDNLYDEQFIHSEDYEIFSRLLLKGYKFLNLNEPLYYLRKNSESVSYKFEKIQISTHTKISTRNLEQFFNRSYEYFIHKVMINRISFNVTPALLKSATHELESLKKKYLKRNLADQKVISQIEDFIIEQKIDIYLQSLKFAYYMNKFIIIIMIIFNLNIFLSARGRLYLRSKFIFTK